jgi:hypothetical protein
MLLCSVGCGLLPCGHQSSVSRMAEWHLESQSLTRYHPSTSINTSVITPMAGWLIGWLID